MSSADNLSSHLGCTDMGLQQNLLHSRTTLIKLIHFKCMRQIYALYIMYCCDDESPNKISVLCCMLMYLAHTISISSDQPAQSDQSLASRLRIL